MLKTLFAVSVKVPQSAYDFKAWRYRVFPTDAMCHSCILITLKNAHNMNTAEVYIQPTVYTSAIIAMLLWQGNQNLGVVRPSFPVLPTLNVTVD